jgi:hypothetical protein
MISTPRLDEDVGIEVWNKPDCCWTDNGFQVVVPDDRQLTEAIIADSESNAWNVKGRDSPGTNL